MTTKTSLMSVMNEIKLVVVNVWNLLIDGADGLASLANIILICIAVASIVYVRNQFGLQRAQHKMTVFLNAVNFINHDLKHGVSRDSLHAGLSIFKAITIGENLGLYKKGEFIFSITITRFLTEKISEVKKSKLWRDFYLHNLRDYYEIGFLVLIMMRTLPAKPAPTFYCFVDFASCFENIYQDHFKKFLNEEGKKLFEKLIFNLNKSVAHLKKVTKRNFSLKKFFSRKWQTFAAPFKKIPEGSDIYKGFRDEDFAVVLVKRRRKKYERS